MPQFSQDEKNRVILTMDEHTRTLAKQNEILEKIEISLESLKNGQSDTNRAIYGDKINNIKGMLERMTHIEFWITKMNLKIVFISGIAFSLWMGVKFCYEYLMKKTP